MAIADPVDPTLVIQDPVDLAALLALVGWTALELIVLWAIGIFRPEPA